jgi:hypothetical protein
VWALGAAIVSNGGRWMKNDDYSDWVEIKKYFLIFKVRVSHLLAKDNINYQAADVPKKSYARVLLRSSLDVAGVRILLVVWSASCFTNRWDNELDKLSEAGTT